MKQIRSLKPGWLACAGLMVTVAVYLAAISFASAVDTPTPASTSAKKKEKKLTGSELYAINCNRCHQERYPTEFTAAQWKTIATHMRVRANLPAAQVKQILKYLQEDAGN